jgi:hypothetical protein
MAAGGQSRGEWLYDNSIDRINFKCNNHFEKKPGKPLIKTCQGLIEMSPV